MRRISNLRRILERQMGPFHVEKRRQFRALWAKLQVKVSVGFLSKLKLSAKHHKLIKHQGRI